MLKDSQNIDLHTIAHQKIAWGVIKMIIHKSSLSQREKYILNFFLCSMHGQTRSDIKCKCSNSARIQRTTDYSKDHLS